MKKLSALLICFSLLTSCGYSAVPDHAKVSEGHFSYDIDGCTFDYTSYIGCSRNDFEGVLKKGDDVICEYSASGYVGNYPAKVVNLFDNVYYVENREVENYDTLYYIAKGGNIYPDFLERDEQKKAEQLEYISAYLNDNITEQEISGIFSECGYDDSYIIGLYNGNIIKNTENISEVHESYEITEGNADGCVFEYTKDSENNGFSGALKVYDDVICEYSADDSVWNYPEKVVHLFDDVYYVCNREYGEGEIRFYIAKGGRMYPDFTETDEQEKHKQLEYISDFLRAKMTEQQITDIFSYCGCEDSNIFVIYNYNKNNEEQTAKRNYLDF